MLEERYVFFFRRSELNASALVHPDYSRCVKCWILGGEGKQGFKNLFRRMTVYFLKSGYVRRRKLL